MNSIDNQPYIAAATAAKKANCDPMTIRRWCQEGKFKFTIMQVGQSHRYLIDKESFEKYLKERNKKRQENNLP